MLRWLAIIGTIIVVVTIALSFHQPPMRLMPTPKVFLDGMPFTRRLDLGRFDFI